MIEEASKRRPEFDEESVPVDFAAGRFFLPKPRIVFRRGKVDGKTVAIPSRTFGVDYDQKLAAVEVAAKDGTVVELMTALFAIAEDLLSRNYELTDDELDAILVVDYNSPPDELLPIPQPWGEVWRAANSLPPKASAPSSSPDS